MWTDTSVDTQAVKKAGVKARLTTGTYMLQTSMAKFSKQGVSPVCQLCHTGDEDIAHFLLSCTSLVRSHFMSKLTSILRKHNLDTCYHDNDDLLVQTILVSGDFVPGRIRTQENSYSKWIGTNSLVNSYLGTKYPDNSYPTYNFYFVYIMCVSIAHSILIFSIKKS